ncbi:hypothetical protein DFH11DRAFT_1540305 [Phellopilus nigrolimitatus]|nr:hypothetical protein DFH11DRAFT_1540305 [Phellopilus nigrolimitatus]
MNNFLRLVASLLILVYAAAAMPQGALSYFDTTKGTKYAFSGYALPSPSKEAAYRDIRFGHAVAPRQIHNADYGASNGPIGNPVPVPAQQTTIPAAPLAAQATPAAASGDSSSSGNGQKRRELVSNTPDSADVNYSDA